MIFLNTVEIIQFAFLTHWIRAKLKQCLHGCSTVNSRKQPVKGFCYDFIGAYTLSSKTKACLLFLKV